jgi:hypothetical protein
MKLWNIGSDFFCNLRWSVIGILNGTVKNPSPNFAAAFIANSANPTGLSAAALNCSSRFPLRSFSVRLDK